MGLGQVDPDDAVRRAEQKQEKEREKKAYKKGAERRELNKGAKAGGPKEDGYENMTSGEKQAYKRGYTGRRYQS